MSKTILAYCARGYEEGKAAWDFQHLAADEAASRGLPINDDAAMAARGLCYAEFPTRNLVCGGESGKAAWGKIAEAIKTNKLQTLVTVKGRSMTIATMVERIGQLVEFAYRTAKAPVVAVDGMEVSEAELEAIRKLRSAKKS